MTVAANKEYHIAFMKGKELCTGKNIQAKDYAEAHQKFVQEHGKVKVLYINEKS